VLRPSDSFLGSSRATHRANVRAERLKTFAQLARVSRSTAQRVWNAAVDLALLCGLPFAYLAASYLALDLPARWLAHRGAYGRWGLLLFALSVVVAVAGLRRALRNAPPVAPVRPKFAKAMLGLSWIAAILCTIGDLAS